MSQKDYELIARAINDARAFAPSDAQHDLVAVYVGKALAGQHRGYYAWNQSRWDTATGVTRQPASI